MSRSYPAVGNLYQYPFVHRRVLAYTAAGHQVAVFRPGGDGGEYGYEGVTCRTGDAGQIARLATAFRPHVVAVHGLAETMWPTLSALPSLPMVAWLHGSEIPDFFRQKARAIADPESRARTLAEVEARKCFWMDLLHEQGAQLKLVFPSNSAVRMMREDLDDRLRNYAVIPNPIDTDLFRYQPKIDDARFRILSIRPFDSTTYGNDLSVAAIRHLSMRPEFDRMRFTIVGDGPLFEDTVAGLDAFENVTIRREFLTHGQIADEHSRHGIFLVPTRLDTQGVSRDEAMSSGLVPVTNSIAPVLEFSDDTCAALAAPDDALGLADALYSMVRSPELFLERSVAAAKRVRSQSSNGIVIPEELRVLREAVISD